MAYMAVTQNPGQCTYIGYAGDAKPPAGGVNYTLIEADTGKHYRAIGNVWQRVGLLSGTHDVNFSTSSNESVTISDPTIQTGAVISVTCYLLTAIPNPPSLLVSAMMIAIQTGSFTVKIVASVPITGTVRLCWQYWYAP